MKVKDGIGLAILASMLFGSMTLAVLDALMWTPERQVKKQQEKMQVFLDTFSVGLPNSEKERLSAQPAVIAKLIEAVSELDIAFEKEQSIYSEWSKTPASTHEGVLRRLAIQAEYDKAAKGKTEAQEKSRGICRIARDTGFNEEARALGCR